MMIAMMLVVVLVILVLVILMLVLVLVIMVVIIITMIMICRWWRWCGTKSNILLKAEFLWNWMRRFTGIY